MNKLYYIVGMLLVVMSLILSGCGPSSSDASASTAKEEANKVAMNTDRLNTNQPAPQFDWSLERYIMGEMMKARNERVSTYSYVISSYTGQILDYCPSIGYPLAANTQMTNPEVVIDFGFGESRSGVTLPQAEQNGLYPSPSTSGTFVPCVNANGDLVPRYMEENVRTYVEPMTMGPDGYLIPNGDAEFVIKLPN